MKERIYISAEEAIKILIQTEELVGFHVSGILNITDYANTTKILRIVNCFIENLKSEAVRFNSIVEIESSELEKCAFSFAYFHGGLNIYKCTFKDYLDFQCGGHNRTTNKLRICESVFNGFVNFFDCVYNGPVEILKNEFKNGTNLLGNLSESYCVHFDIAPTIQDNKGHIDLDGEAGLKMNSVVI